jgi:hypothetical protein
MNKKEINAPGTEILRVEMYKYKGETFFRLISGDKAIYGFKSVGEALEARYDLAPGTEFINRIMVGEDIGHE